MGNDVAAAAGSAASADGAGHAEGARQTVGADGTDGSAHMDGAGRPEGAVGADAADRAGRPGRADRTHRVGGPGRADGPVRVDDGLLAAVEDAVRQVVAAEVVPRWRSLAEGDIAQKTGPHDLVTVADRRAEERLTERLTALLPGSAVVGEEAVAADPGVLGLLHGDAPVWVVDPIDGTAAFVRGDEGFSTLVSLVHRGEPLASWTYAPQLDLFATARRGSGARLGDRVLRTATAGGPLRIWTSNPVYRDDAERAVLARLAAAGAECRPCRTSAGLAYLDVARGLADGVAFFWEAPWDHAAGLLLVTEAGGASLTAAGEPFRIAGGNALPFTVARDAVTAAHVVDMMVDVTMDTRADATADATADVTADAALGVPGVQR